MNQQPSRSAGEKFRDEKKEGNDGESGSREHAELSCPEDGNVGGSDDFIPPTGEVDQDSGRIAKARRLKRIEQVKEPRGGLPGGHQNSVTDDQTRGMSPDMENIPFTEFAFISGEVFAQVGDLIASFGEVSARARVIKNEDPLGKPHFSRCGFLKSPEPDECETSGYAEHTDECSKCYRTNRYIAPSDPESRQCYDDGQQRKIPPEIGGERFPIPRPFAGNP